MYCYKLTLAYDGTHYNGWQIQRNAPSIQKFVQDALAEFLGGEKVLVIGSGRTDAGVHALNQIAHFTSSRLLDLNRLHLALNALLPGDIRVKKVEIALPDFHARYSAIGKEYHYHICLDRIMDPFQRFYCWHLIRKLNLDLLKEASAIFVGKHDFTSFANERYAGAVSKNPVRTIYRLDVCRMEGGVRLEFEGDGFLYKMVRNIVGTLVDVSSGRTSMKELFQILEAKDRQHRGIAAPATGLFLVRVDYPISQG